MGGQGGWRACDLAREAAREAFEASSGAAAGETGAPSPIAEAEPAAAADAAEAEDDDALTAPLLCAEAAHCTRAAMTLSRAGRIKEAEGALKLAERYRDLALSVPALAAAESGGSGAPRDTARSEALWKTIHGWVRSALNGRIERLPLWARTKAFLADTPYADQYLREPDAAQEEPEAEAERRARGAD